MGNTCCSPLDLEEEYVEVDGDSYNVYESLEEGRDSYIVRKYVKKFRR
jgi:hypothetical protein